MKGFTFFDSYYEAGQALSINERRQFIDALICYAYDIDTPDDLTPTVQAMLILVRPVLDKSKTQRKNSSKSETKREPNENQTQTKREPNQNQSELLTSEELGVRSLDLRTPKSPFLGEAVENSVLDATFELLWGAFPKCNKKPQALKIWHKLNPDSELIITILEAVEEQKRSIAWLENDGRYVPMLTTWLTNERWNDSLGQMAKKPPKEVPKHIAQARRLLGLDDFKDVKTNEIL